MGKIRAAISAATVCPIRLRLQCAPYSKLANPSKNEVVQSVDEPIEFLAAAQERIVYDESIKLIEMPEHDSISVCVFNEHDGLFQLGERINALYEEAYMNGYNWDAVIKAYVAKADPSLMSEVETDPEAGMFSAYMSYSPENVDKMKRFESHVRAMVADEKALVAFIEENRDDIEWD